MSNTRQPDTDESPLRSIMLIGLIIGSVLLISISGLAVYIVSRTSSNTTSGVGLLMPYNVELRALPSATNSDPNAILPPNVGSFARKSLGGGLGAVTGSLSASYISGSVSGSTGAASIAIKVSLDANDDQAQTDFTRLVGSSPWKRDALQQIRGAGFFQATDPKSGSVRFIFVQHYWLFDITANSKLVLDAFMAAYPY
jgi:hypothetical protein